MRILNKKERLVIVTAVTKQEGRKGKDYNQSNSINTRKGKTGNRE